MPRFDDADAARPARDGGGRTAGAAVAVPLRDVSPSLEDFRNDIVQGLRRRPKSTPAKYFYDERGSALFDRICELDEYYPTRTELAIMQAHVREMAQAAGDDCCLVEFGSGSSLKTRILLDHLGDRLAAYVPVDISLEHLAHTAERLREAYPKLKVVPVCADFTQPFELPDGRTFGRRRIVYFPGSTLGNFHRDAARRLLRMIARACGEGGGLLIGVDLEKDRETLERAYNDSQGVTAQFNLNLLRRINRELDADFNLRRFRHRAVYNAEAGRMEMHLVSLAEQAVHIGDEEFHFDEGETIHTEISCKYTLEGFRKLAESAGLAVRQVWTDPKQWFSVQYLEVAGEPTAPGAIRSVQA